MRPGFVLADGIHKAPVRLDLSIRPVWRISHPRPIAGDVRTSDTPVQVSVLEDLEEAFIEARPPVSNF